MTAAYVWIIIASTWNAPYTSMPETTRAFTAEADCNAVIRKYSLDAKCHPFKVVPN